MGWQAGAAAVVITPPVGGELEGYGGRTDPSTGVHDDLLARALVLEDGERRAGLVTCDLISVDAPIVAAVRREVQAQWGIPPERLMVTATHTHAGPRGVLHLRTAGDPDLTAFTTRAISGALRAAAGQIAPARLMAGAGNIDSVSLNRRFVDRPVDSTVRVLRVEGEDGALRAALLNYACHPTVLSARNLRISQDWPGAAARAIQKLWGDEVVVLVANGACADVNPVKITEDFDEVRRVGTIVGAEASRVLGELAAHGRRQVVHNLRWSEHTLKAPSVGVEVSPDLAGAIVPVTLPWKQFASDEDYRARVAGLRAEAAAIPAGEAGLEQRRALMPRLTALSTEAGTAAWGRRALVEHPHGFQTEVQALRLGPEALFVGLPGEVMVAIGDAVRRQSAAPETFVLGYANDAAGYLVTDATHDELGYEAGCTLFTRDVQAILAGAAQQALTQIGGAR
ncbi:MAG TPA: neutral/alkaline non-lysosomal ceramidase N-terminal domain-containing protein [Dehalococcoidia bacterium]|jgi:hypothetical protein